MRERERESVRERFVNKARNRIECECSNSISIVSPENLNGKKMSFFRITWKLKNTNGMKKTTFFLLFFELYWKMFWGLGIYSFKVKMILRWLLVLLLKSDIFIYHHFHLSVQYFFPKKLVTFFKNPCFPS